MTKEDYIYLESLVRQRNIPEIICGLRKLSTPYLEKFFSQYKEIRNVLLNKEFVQEYSDIFSLFLDLPKEKKDYLAYYEYYEVEKSKENFILLLRNNFKNLEEPIEKKVGDYFQELDFYSFRYLLKQMSNAMFWQKIEQMTQNYFKEEKEAILFFYKHPHLYTELAQNQVELKMVIQKIQTLKEKPYFTYSSFLDATPKYLLKSHGEVIEYISPTNEFSLARPILKYYREVAAIRPNGRFIERDALSHELTLLNMFAEYEGEATSVRYLANLDGHIIFTIENAAMLIWLPPYFTEKSFERLHLVMKHILEKKDILPYIRLSSGIALPDYKEEYRMIKEGMFMTISEFIEEISYLEIKSENYTLKKTF